jgi:hypothetical protein
MLRLVSGLIILAFLLALPSIIPKRHNWLFGVAAEAQSGYRIGMTTMGSAGFIGSGAPYMLSATMGQPTPICTGRSSNKTLLAGFWGRYWIPTDVDETPVVFRNDLFQNFPNPFNPLTTIEYSVSTAGSARIAIFNANGQRVRLLVRENKSPGRYRVIWDGRNDPGALVASGIYFYRLEVGTYSSVRKMMVLR